jgi:hypothetical protein
VCNTHFVFLNEIDEGCSFDLDWLWVTVVKGENEMEEVRLAEIARRLLLEVGSSNSKTGKSTIITVYIQLQDWQEHNHYSIYIRNQYFLPE